MTGQHLIRIALFAALLWPAGVAAQDARPAKPPVEPLFGRNTPGSGLTHRVDTNLTVAGGNDDNVGLALGIDDGRVGVAARFLSFDGNVIYARDGRRTQFAGSAGVSLRRLSGVGFNVSELPSYSGGLGWSAQTSAHTRVRVDQSIIWSPYYDFGMASVLGEPVLGAAQPVTADQAALQTRTIRSATMADFEHQWSDRMSYRIDYGFRLAAIEQSAFTNAATVFQHSAGLRVSRRLSDSLAVRVGYGFESAPDAVIFGSRDVDRTFRAGNNHAIDVGLDFVRPLTLGRRTTLLFSAGSAVATARGPGQGAVDDTGAFVDEPTTGIGLIGRARLEQRIAGSWTVSGGYERSADYVEIIDATVFSDAVGVDVKGLLSRRVEIFGVLDYRKTSGVYTLGGDRFATGRGNLTVRAAATRRLALFAEYSYFSYRINTQFQLPNGFAPALDRQSVRVGATLWLSLLRH
jgi:hypothetical protein